MKVFQICHTDEATPSANVCMGS